MINPTMTVREVALDLPESTRLFEQLKIDYCCGGHRPLTEACASAGLEINQVMELLANVSQSKAPQGTIDFQKLSLSELITHILETHHAFTRSEMTRIEALGVLIISNVALSRLRLDVRATRESQFNAQNDLCHDRLQRKLLAPTLMRLCVSGPPPLDRLSVPFLCKNLQPQAAILR
jgi:regulator of cell morphogenesis and NO signaling